MSNKIESLEQDLVVSTYSIKDTRDVNISVPYFIVETAIYRFSKGWASRGFTATCMGGRTSKYWESYSRGVLLWIGEKTAIFSAEGDSTWSYWTKCCYLCCMVHYLFAFPWIGDHSWWSVKWTGDNGWVCLSRIAQESLSSGNSYKLFLLSYQLLKSISVSRSPTHAFYLPVLCMDFVVHGLFLYLSFFDSICSRNYRGYVIMDLAANHCFISSAGFILLTVWS